MKVVLATLSQISSNDTKRNLYLLVFWGGAWAEETIALVFRDENYF